MLLWVRTLRFAKTTHPFVRDHPPSGGVQRPERTAMEKALCYGALGVAALMLLLFVLDIATGIPFGSGPFITYDILGLIAAGIIGYLGFSSLKDLK